MNTKLITQDDIDIIPNLLSSIGYYTWSNLHPSLNLNKAKMKKLMQALRRTWNHVLRFGNSQNKEIQKLYEDNAKVWYKVIYTVSLGHLQEEGAYDREDVEFAMQAYCYQWERGVFPDPIILQSIYRAFNKYLDPNKPSHVGLDHIFKLKEDKVKHRDPYTIPDGIRKFAAKLIETGDTKAAIVRSLRLEQATGFVKRDISPEKAPKLKGLDYYTDNFKIYKWWILDDYLFEKAIVKKNMFALTTKQRERVKKHWGIELPEKLHLLEEKIPAGDIEAIRRMLNKLR